MPSCSIIIPCYNYSEYLFECLESVINQTVSDWEAIVIDDGSTNGNIDEIVSRFNDQRIEVIHHHQNFGLAAARNTGIKSSNSEFILPLDSDDKLSPNYLEILLPLLKNNPDCNYSFPNFLAFGQVNKVLKYENKDILNLLLEQSMPGPGSLFRKSLWENAKGYCEELRWNEDWDFLISGIENGLKIVNTPLPLYYYRVHHGSLTSQLNVIDYRTREIMYIRHNKLFDQNGMKDRFLSEGYLRSAHAWFSKGNHIQASILALKCAQFSSHRIKAIILTVLFFLPSFIFSFLRYLREFYFNFKISAREELTKILYRNKVGRMLYWTRRSKSMDQKYGNLTHDYRVVNMIIDQISPQRIIDIGCGGGRLFPLFLAKNLSEIVGQDISHQLLDLARKRFPNKSIHLTNQSLEVLNFATDYFDLAICNRVLQHIPPREIETAIRKICEISRYVYINESEYQDNLPKDIKIFYHDYILIFSKFGFSSFVDGYISNENYGKQHWKLFKGFQKTT